LRGIYHTPTQEINIHDDVTRDIGLSKYLTLFRDMVFMSTNYVSGPTHRTLQPQSYTYVLMCWKNII